jgi:hypothetical protein
MKRFELDGATLSEGANGRLRAEGKHSKSVTLEITRAERAIYIKRKMPIHKGCAMRRLPSYGAWRMESVPNRDSRCQRRVLQACV